MEQLTFDEKLFKRIVIFVLIAVLLVLSFLILEPILLSTIFGLILAFIFYPIYKKVLFLVREKNIASLIVCIGVILVILLPLWFLIPVLAKQAFEPYSSLPKIDLTVPLEALFPSSISPEFSRSIIVAVNSFISDLASSFLSNFTAILLNSPIILLHFFLILFIFFFGLRDGEALINYIQALSPLSKEADKRIFQQFRDMTYAVIFGEILVGIIQGIVTGIGLFIFGVPHALILTLVATLAGILPVIGPWLVWVPVDLWLFLNGDTSSAIGLLVYGLILITWIDTPIRSFIVSKRTKINSAVILVSMVGGLLVFGTLGLIIGPLIISYLLLLLEFYKQKRATPLVESIKT